MTSVSNLRSQYDHADSPQKQQAARDAALRGAQLAFPRHSLLHSSSTATPSDLRFQTDAKNAASLSAGRHAVALSKLSIPDAQASNASLGAVRAHQRSREALLDPHRRSLSVDSFAQKTESPSNVAAALAAARFSPHIQPAPTLPPHHRYLARPVSTGPIPEEEQLPVPGTVTDVRRWLQTLDESGEDQREDPVVNERKSRNGGRRRSSGAHRQGYGEPIVTRAAALPLKHSPPRPRIVSPRPIRTISVTESLEARTSQGPRSKRAPHDGLARPRPSAVTSPPGLNPDDNATPPSAYYDAEELPLFPNEPSVPARAHGPTTDHVLGPSLLHDPKPDPPPPRRSRPTAKGGDTFDENASAARSFTARKSSSTADPSRRSLSVSPNLDQMVKKREVHRSVSAEVTTKLQPIVTSPPIITRKVTPHMTGDSLANAIVAGSLASSRAPSPTKSPGPGYHNRPADKHRLSIPFFGREGESRAVSPAKPMPKTMRKQSTSSSEEDRAHKRSRNPFRKHPNKHHEGDRKRWREELTELERKRYEGVWAANKGMHTESSAPGAADAVSGLVVRDIWRRSRLPDHVLEEVWELVDTEASGRLGRAEFVVGLWLVDQRLKGRKLPVKVQPTVWRSARGVHGLKIRQVK